MNYAGLVTVIVPVYNNEEYISTCVDSLLSQTYQYLEIMLVDDGSSDSSGELCDGFASSDSRVKVIHKSNGGLSDARNSGLANASGEWISFVDGDDWVSPVFIETLLAGCVTYGCKMAFLPYGTTFWDGDDCKLIETVEETGPVQVVDSRTMQRMLLYQVLETSAPFRLYRRELLGDNPFPVGLLYEDLATIYRIVHKVDVVTYIDCLGLYAYRQRHNSIVHGGCDEDWMVRSATQVADQLESEICEWYPNLRAAAASRVFSLCRLVYSQTTGTRSNGKDMSDSQDRLWHYLDQRKDIVLHDPCARKRERLAAAIACLGRGPFGTFCKLCRRMGLMR